MPVGNTGSLEEFSKFWYSAQKFANPTSYGFHGGEDINLLTGGDTDLGQELKAITNGKIVYYHYSSHPTYGFGRHLVLKIDGPWGTRWVHYAHLTENDFINNVQDVNEGQIIGRLGKSGTPYAHLHFAIFKVDPATMPNGIDNIPNTLAELNQYWEDPFAFIKKWITAPAPVPQPDIRLTLLDQAGITDEGKTREAIERYNRWDQLQNDLNNANIELENLKNQYGSLKSRIKTSVNNAIDSTN
jgi:hypothetical protein